MLSPLSILLLYITLDLFSLSFSFELIAPLTLAPFRCFHAMLFISFASHDSRDCHDATLILAPDLRCRRRFSPRCHDIFSLRLSPLTRLLQPRRRQRFFFFFFFFQRRQPAAFADTRHAAMAYFQATLPPCRQFSICFRRYMPPPSCFHCALRQRFIILQYAAR
jgi:hypothetical protein